MEAQDKAANLSEEEREARAREFATTVPEYAVSEIIEAVKAGVWGRDKAETLAAELGVGPLEGGPPVEEYTPWEIRHWPLSMALAWIVVRSDDGVRLHGQNTAQSAGCGLISSARTKTETKSGRLYGTCRRRNRYPLSFWEKGTATP